MEADRPFEKRSNLTGDGDRVLARSENYTVRSSWETVILEGRDLPAGFTVDIGDFYGNPAGAVIAPDERWVAVWGCGLIVYWLIPPFDAYVDGRATAQHLDLGRDPADVWWITSAEVEDATSVRFVVSEGDHRGTYRIRLTPLRPRPEAIA